MSVHGELGFSILRESVLIRVVLSALIASSTVAAHSDDEISKATGLFSRGESFSYSEANSLKALMNVLIGPAPEDGNNALSRNSIELGYRWRGLEASIIHRNDQNIRFSDGASQFAYLNQNGKDIPLDQPYPVDVEANQYQLTGLKFGYTLPIKDSFEVFAYYAYYEATEAVSGYLGKNPNGDGGFIGITQVSSGGQTGKNLYGQLYTDYYYTDDPFFKREVDAPTGTAYSIDVGMRWQMLPNLTLELGIYDALGEISWDDIPHTTATATSDIFVVAPDGKVEIYPNFSGTEDFRDFTQDLTQRQKLTLDYRFKHAQLAYEYDDMGLVAFHRIVGGYHWSDRWGISTSYDFTSEALGFKLKMPAGDFAITFDELDFENAHTLGLSWNLTYVF